LLPFKLDNEPESKLFSRKTITTIRSLNKKRKIPDKVLMIIRQIKELGI